MQQLSFADGWLSSCGAAAQHAPSANDALHHQIQWLASNHGQIPMVHLFDGGSQALLRRIDALRVDWLAQCTATTRIQFDSRSEEHTSELQSLMRISYAVFCL